MVLAVFVIYCVYYTSLYSARYLATNVSPIFPVIGIVLLFYSITFLLRAGCIDPGIVPRAPQSEADYFIKQSTPGE